MAESPYKITRSDDGLSVRCEFDAHYVSDEDAQRIRVYIDQLQAENAELQDENARLRSCLSDDAENARMIMGENAKLRELVRDTYKLCWNGLDCTECPRSFYDRCDKSDGCSWLGILHVRMRELGIEVD